MDIAGKKVIVTGGANGIGKAVVKKLIDEHALVGVFDIDNEHLNQLSDQYPNIFCKLCDVTKNNEVELAVNEFFEAYKGIDILINNAGMTRDAPLVSLSGGIRMYNIEIWNSVIASNLSSVFYMGRSVAEKMVQRRTQGLIINVSSVSAHGNAGQSAYSAAKAGVNALTKVWAKELNPLGIRVAGIAPGFTKTNIVEQMDEHIVDEWNKKIPLKRMAEPDEIANGILFIIKNDYVNGKILELDGGLVL
jgi:3-oxoacyl-[acyl-carrier protein] reductase